MDIHVCIDHLRLNANRYRLDDNHPPHSIIEWPDSNPDEQPTVAQLEAAWEECEDRVIWQEARAIRDQRLRDSDWTAVTDTVLSEAEQTAWAEYRQELRDIPQIYDDVDDVVWPESPEE